MNAFAKLLVLSTICQAVSAAEAIDYERQIAPLLTKYCFDCHSDGRASSGELDMAALKTMADHRRERQSWLRVFDKVESHQMPPPKDSPQPSATERQLVLNWIRQLAASPDPALGASDPGKPVLRRLTRLEYNNTVRDLLGLETDVFVFSERLPLANKNYYQPASGKMGQELEIRLREYGAKYPVLLPQTGLPADNRAEHGYRNQGAAMNVSPLLVEQYLGLAREIAQHPQLFERSSIMAELAGIERPEPMLVAPPPGKARHQAVAVGGFAPQGGKLHIAEGSADNVDWRFKEDVTAAFEQECGGVFDVPAALVNQTLAGKGEVLKIRFGKAESKTLSINPNNDLWFAPFASANETSGETLFCNKVKGEKTFELSLKMEQGEEDEGISRLAICVLGRDKQSGQVSLIAKFSDGTESKATSKLAAGADGTTFFSFTAVPGETITSLIIDGSKFSGDYVLLDDLGFITNGKPRRAGALQTKPESKEKSASNAPSKVKARKTVEQRLAEFLARALRRPVQANDAERYLNLYREELRQRNAVPDALRAVLQAVLASPSFLFLSEPHQDDAPAVRPLSDYELAVRLSYFLWSSMPDDELLQIAAKNMLHESQVLEQQTRRMLRDPRSRELSESFAVQWLRLDQIYTAKPDRELFKTFYAGPQGKGTLHGAQLVEALLLFETVLIEDRSIIDFLAADYTWVNPQLAKLYQLSDPLQASEMTEKSDSNRELKTTGKDNNNQWRRIKLSNSSRGGYLTMSGPLTITSLPFRTSPVKRGAWLLETIFNRPPTEPKVAFSVSNDTKEAAQAQSIRERFEAHRRDAACYTCHIRLDPPGFALESFDAIGTLRTHDAGQPIDARGEWSGQKFAGPAEYKAILAAQPAEFRRGLIEHLLSFALGRKLELFDLPVVEQISQAVENEQRLQQIICEIVKSRSFTWTRNQDGK